MSRWGALAVILGSGGHWDVTDNNGPPCGSAATRRVCRTQYKYWGGGPRSRGAKWELTAVSSCMQEARG